MPPGGWRRYEATSTLDRAWGTRLAVRWGRGVPGGAGRPARTAPGSTSVCAHTCVCACACAGRVRGVRGHVSAADPRLGPGPAPRPGCARLSSPAASLSRDRWTPACGAGSPLRRERQEEPGAILTPDTREDTPKLFARPEMTETPPNVVTGTHPSPTRAELRGAPPLRLRAPPGLESEAAAGAARPAGLRRFAVPGAASPRRVPLACPVTCPVTCQRAPWSHQPRCLCSLAAGARGDTAPDQRSSQTGMLTFTHLSGAVRGRTGSSACGRKVAFGPDGVRGRPGAPHP